MSIRHTVLTAAAIISAAVAAQQPGAAAATPQTCREVAQTPVATAVIDSIERRDDLTRVYVRYIGRPHTSDRIDGVTLSVGRTRYYGEDIDGVDFRRYFQWEDEGVIPLEIDFGPMPTGYPLAGAILTFDTVHGTLISEPYK